MQNYDLSIYNLDALRNFVSTYIAQYQSQPIISAGKSEEAFQQAKAKKEMQSRYFMDCPYGDSKEREFAKLFIKQLITSEERDKHIFMNQYPEDYKVTEENIDYFIDFANTESIYIRFKILLYSAMRQHGTESLAYLIEKYHLNKLRVDQFGDELFFVTPEDLVKIYLAETPVLNYDMKLDIMAQILYENYKGMGIIDDLLYQDKLDEISFGVYGLPNDVTPKTRKYYYKDLPKAYDAIVVRYRGNPIQLRFLSFGSWEEMERINKNIIKYEQSKGYSQKDARLYGFRKNGSRVTVAREPFTECRVAWVRNFHISDVAYNELVKGFGTPIKGWEMNESIVKIMMRGGATTCVSGPQGTGKSTAMLAMTEYCYAFETLRLIETVFELQARRRYPNRDIVTMQATEYLDEVEGYNFSLRTSGDITFIGEIREDRMIAQIIKAANRGSKFTVFSFHPNKPDLCIMELANALMRERIYSSLPDALTAVLKTIRCSVQLSKNVERGDRYYNIYEFVPYEITIPDAFRKAADQDQLLRATVEMMYAFFEKQTTRQIYSTVPILEYDADENRYILQNLFSQDLYHHMYGNIHKQEDRMMLKKYFKPEEFVMGELESQHKDLSRKNIASILNQSNYYFGTEGEKLIGQIYERIRYRLEQEPLLTSEGGV